MELELTSGQLFLRLKKVSVRGMKHTFVFTEKRTN